MPITPQNTRVFLSDENFVCAIVGRKTHYCGYVMMSTELYERLESDFCLLEFGDEITYEGKSIFGDLYGKAVGFDTDHDRHEVTHTNIEAYALSTTRKLSKAIHEKASVL